MALIGIIGGKGKMGKYFADIFRRAGHEVIISDLKTKLTNAALASKSDVIIVSVPISKTAQVIKKIVHLVKKDAALVDLTSLKISPIKEMLKAKSEVIGLHPMFAATNSLPGQTIIACPIRTKKWFNVLNSIFIQQGAKVEILTPQEHDQIMAIVQALVHFSDIAFGHALAKLTKLKIPISKFLKYAGPASELKIAFAARLLAQDPELYGSIQMENPYATAAINQFSQSIQELISINDQKNLPAFKKYFNSAANGFGTYKQEALADTNFLIYSLLQRRGRKQFNIRADGRSVQKPDLAILGPQFTNTDLAARQHFTANQTKNYCTSIDQVFEQIEKGVAKQGIVPIENNLHGTVRETLDQLFQRNVHIVEKFNSKITYDLVAIPGVKLKEINTIISHEQAINQCKLFLKKHFTEAQIEHSATTIAGLEKVLGANDRSSAVIIPSAATAKFNLQVLAKNIQDQQSNKTTFVVIAKGPAGPNKAPANATEKSSSHGIAAKNTQTSIAFYFKKDRPGSLLEVFQEFAHAGINLTGIESRPSRRELGNYIFYLDFIGNPTDPNCKKVLQKIRQKVAELKILGAYS